MLSTQFLFLKLSASARQNQLYHNNVWYFSRASCKTVQPLTSERRNHTRGLFHKNFLMGGNTVGRLRRQNITYSLLHQIITQRLLTESSREAGGRGINKKKVLILWRRTTVCALLSVAVDVRASSCYSSSKPKKRRL